MEHCTYEYDVCCCDINIVLLVICVIVSYLLLVICVIVGYCLLVIFLYCLLLFCDFFFLTY